MVTGGMIRLIKEETNRCLSSGKVLPVTTVMTVKTVMMMTAGQVWYGDFQQFFMG